jgi:hypothetical protein
MADRSIGFDPDEIRTDEPTRCAPLKWVIVVDRDLPAGRITNAAACAAAATTPAVTGLLGPASTDQDGWVHPGLPWAGCTILAGDADTLRRVRDKALARPDMFVADMPIAAQETRVYDDYVARLGELGTEKIDYAAVSIVGPCNPVDKIVGKLPLLP